MVYAIYARQREDIAVNACLTAFGNNSVSLLAGVIIFSTIFALEPGGGATELISGSGSTNTGLAFIFLPQLFQRMPGGAAVQTFFSTIFFLGLSVAALTSLISMIELVVRVLMDLGIARPRAIVLVAVFGFVFGLPSALSVTFLNNQDWVWGVALMISGGFIAFAVIRHGADRLRREVINGEGADVQVGRWYNTAIGVLVPLQVVVLVGWWLWAATQWDPGGWWHPFRADSVGTCLFQWGIVMIGLVLANRWLVRRTQRAAVP
jgi:NSS family neurotransmitter:Na+ symporter